MTLNGRNVALVEVKFYGAHRINFNEGRPILSAEKCRPMILVSGNTRYSICNICVKACFHCRCALRCVAWRAIVTSAMKRFNAIADCHSPRNATRSRNGNRPLRYHTVYSHLLYQKNNLIHLVCRARNLFKQLTFYLDHNATSRFYFGYSSAKLLILFSYV